MEYGDHVYFFFRETAVEYINCGKVRVPVHITNIRIHEHEYTNELGQSPSLPLFPFLSSIYPAFLHLAQL